MADRSWTSAELATALCDNLVKKGQLKEKPTFIRSDREKKICDYFEGIGLDGEKMYTFDNPGPLEMAVRKGTNAEAWVQQVIDGLVEMLPEGASKATKKMGMDENTKAELEEAKAKTEQRRERQERDEGGERGEGGGGGKGGPRNPPREREERGGWDSAPRDAGKGKGDRGGDREERGWGGGGDNGRGAGGKGYNGGGDRGGDREDRGGGWGDSSGGRGGKSGGKGGGTESMQCYNCDNMGHSSRDCPEPRKDTGKGKGKRYDRKAMLCDNCGNAGHKSRDCPEPVDEEKVRARLAAKANRDAGGD